MSYEYVNPGGVHPADKKTLIRRLSDGRVAMLPPKLFNCDPATGKLTPASRAKSLRVSLKFNFWSIRK